MKYNRVTKCRVCKGELMELITLGEQTSVGFTDTPVEGDKVPLELMLCLKCYLCQLKYTTNPEILYNENYGYKSGVNETMRTELADIVDSVIADRDDLVVDIGCNDGTLLSNYPVDVYRVGFDPSLGVSLNKGNQLAMYCMENLSRGGASYKVFREYFSAMKFKSVFHKRKAKVITAIAMFYDLDDPNKFLQDMKDILAEDGTIVIQQNYLVGMLKNIAFDNICHEHLEYYSLYSLEKLLDRNGLEVVDVEERSINGGSFRTYIQRKNPFAFISPSVQKMRDKEMELGLDTTYPYTDFANEVYEIAGNLRHFVQKKVKEGKKVYVYGASTRGNSLLQVCQIDNTLISGAAERNPTKFGKYTAGTKIKIVSEEEARKDADYFLVLPWFFRDEFIERERDFIAKGGHLIFPLPKIEVI